MSKSEDPLDESMDVLKTSTCDTLTKKSKLTYHVGCLPDGEVYFRIHKNSGNGFFSDEWIALEDIQKALAKVPVGKPVTSIVLNDLFRGKSVNTPGFLLAVLVKERLLHPMKGKKRSHEAVDTEEFRTKMDSLMSSGSKPKGTTRKTAEKTTAASTKKTGGNATVKEKAAASRRKKTASVRGS